MNMLNALHHQPLASLCFSYYQFLIIFSNSTKMTYVNTLVPTLIFMSCFTFSRSLESKNGDNNYVQDACNVTNYHDLCIHTLSPFSKTAKRSSTRWARAGVSVAIGEAKSAAYYLMKLKARNSMEGRRRVALIDCVECVQDALDNLHQSLGVLRKLSGQTFDTEMGDVTTWMSSALTDEDTCLDGFEDGHGGEQVKQVQNRVKKVWCITSNALALVNKLATTGPETPSDP